MIPKFPPRLCSQFHYWNFSWLLQHFSLSISDGVIQRVCCLFVSLGVKFPHQGLNRNLQTFILFITCRQPILKSESVFFSTRWNFSIEIKINKKSQSNHLFHSKKPICNSLKISKEEFHEKIVIQAFLDLRWTLNEESENHVINVTSIERTLQ